MRKQHVLRRAQLRNIAAAWYKRQGGRYITMEEADAATQGAIRILASDDYQELRQASGYPAGYYFIQYPSEPATISAFEQIVEQVLGLKQRVNWTKTWGSFPAPPCRSTPLPQK